MTSKLFETGIIGITVGFLLNSTSISDEIQAAQSEEKFRGLLEFAPAAMGTGKRGGADRLSRSRGRN